MRWSIRIARIAGSDVDVHVTFLAFLAWIGVAHYLEGGARAAAEGLAFILLLFSCVLLHELGHALAAARFGIRTPDITLLPIGGVARLQRMPDKPAQELAVALAGPAVNVLIALVLGFVLGRIAGVDGLARLDDPRVGMLAKLFSVNVALVLFNLIPAFPMDGGRVLRALLALHMDHLRATQIAASVGQAVAFVLGFWGLFANPLLIFVALFVYVGAAQEASLARMRDLAEHLPLSAAMMSRFDPLPLSASLEDAVDLLLRTSQHEFPLVDAVGRSHGVLTRDRLIEALRERGPQAPAFDVMIRDLPEVESGTRLDEAFTLMQERGSPALQVVDARGRLVGLLTPENVGEMIMVRSALERHGPRRRVTEGPTSSGRAATF